jgi:hypothetical protein
LNKNSEKGNNKKKKDNPINDKDKSKNQNKKFHENGSQNTFLDSKDEIEIPEKKNKTELNHIRTNSANSLINSEKRKEENENKATDDNSEKDSKKPLDNNDKRKCIKILVDNLLKNFCMHIKFGERNEIFYGFYIFIFLLHTYIFFNTLLFSVNEIQFGINIHFIKSLLENNFVRFFYSYCLCIVLVKSFEWILNKTYECSKKCWLIINSLIVLFHLLYTYYIIIFSIINSYATKNLYVSLLLFIIAYLIISKVICYIFLGLRFCRLKGKCKCLFDL